MDGPVLETGPVCSEMDSAALKHTLFGRKVTYCVLSLFANNPVQRHWDIVFQTLFKKRSLRSNQGGRMETGPVCSEIDSAALQHALFGCRGTY